MRCGNCGAEINDQLLFCPSCGALVKSRGAKPDESGFQAQPLQAGEELEPHPQPVTVPISEPEPSASDNGFEILPSSDGDSGMQGEKGPSAISQKVLAGAVAALAVVVIILSVVLLSSGNQDNRNVTESNASQSEVKQAQVEKDIHDEYGASASDEIDELEEKAGGATTAHNSENQQAGSSEYDLSDPEDYRLINTFLSNFSEVYGHTASLDTSSMSAEDFARFGVYHCGINSYGDWQFADGAGAYSDVQGVGGGAQGVYNVRIDGSRVAEMVNRYFGADIDYGSISGGYRGPYHYQDGYVYFGVTAPVTPAGVAIAKSIEHLGNSEYEIEFDVYTPSGWYYDASDAALYSAPAAEVAARMGVSSPAASGTAIVRKSGSSEYTGGLVLESYQSKLL